MESNWIFDDARDTLRHGGRLLRLRRSGHEWTLTVKGKRRAGPLKQRPEFETKVGDGKACRALLAELGFRERINYRRWRTTFERPRQTGELAWDETPFGIYLEIEGTEAWVRRTAAALGLAISGAEQRSYPELYAAHQG
jgi:adenylate cyclase class 2